MSQSTSKVEDVLIMSVNTNHVTYVGCRLAYSTKDMREKQDRGCSMTDTRTILWFGMTREEKIKTYITIKGYKELISSSCRYPRDVVEMLPTAWFPSDGDMWVRILAWCKEKA